MSAQDFIDFVTVTGSPSFRADVEAGIIYCYQSPYMASILENLMYSADPLNISEGSQVARYIPATLTVEIDFDYATHIEFVNQNGSIVNYTKSRVLLHELLHAALSPALDDPLASDVVNGIGSWRGEIVDLENSICQQLGDTSIRTGYFGGTAPTLLDYSFFHNAMFSSFGHTVDNSIYLSYDTTGVKADIKVNNGETNLIIAANNVNNINGGSGADIAFAHGGEDKLYGNGGDDFLFGGLGDDWIEGGDGSDVIAGDSGNDFIYGGSGGDRIFFDPHDVNGSGFIDGDSGQDLAIFGAPQIDTSGINGVNYFSDALSLDLTSQWCPIQNIEAILLGTGADSITADTATTRILAGGDGNDNFTINARPIHASAPQVIWGGGGSDNIYLNSAIGDNSAASIVVVNVEGLSQDNFHKFDFNDLDVDTNFDWSKVDVIVLNPDASDKVYVNGRLLESNGQNIPIYEYIPNKHDPDHTDPADWDQINMGNVGIDDVWAGDLNFFADHLFFGNWPRVVREIDITDQELHYEGTITAPIYPSYRFVAEYRDSEIGTWISPTFEEGGEIDVPQEEIPLEFGPYHIGTSDDYDLSGASGVSPWIDEIAGVAVSEYRLHFFYWEDLTPWDYSPEWIVPWYIVGGGLDGTHLTGGFNYTMPDPEDEEPNGTPSKPMGGVYASSSYGTNLTTGSSGFRLSSFDPNRDTVVVNGIALSAASLGSGVSAAEYKGSTFITYGHDDFVLLRGVSLAAWQAGAAGQILGGLGDDALTGTAGNDVFAGGGGDDTITAGAGDDHITYSSGDDVMLGGLDNTGTDTLDLGRFAASDVRFAVSGDDVLITTTDGTIRLADQVLHEVGDPLSNIEAITLSDGTLSETDILVRAIADQQTIGDDVIQGTSWVDYINGSAGNDIITGGAGADEFWFADSFGNDEITDFEATDHIVFVGSQTISDFTDMLADHTTQVGSDVLIADGDGNTVLIKNFLMANLSESNFQFW